MSNNAINPAHGGFARGEADLSSISRQYSSQDMPSHTKLKYREKGQNSVADIVERDLRVELEDRERKSSHTAKKRKLVPEPQLMALAKLDADDPIEDSSESSDDSGESDEETTELYAELNRIKRERAQEELLEMAKNKEEEELIRRENILRGNPLFNIRDPSLPQIENEFTVKRRWNDDVVFKNCAKSVNDNKPVTFINDSLRSSFHRRFMDKYIK
ncbi:hypothetical protein GJ496_000634 [Pomphorhynchus laevis]|nr:hypothetical protein GJ496_000634 [Pomphorhynchus laevis]